MVDDATGFGRHNGLSRGEEVALDESSTMIDLRTTVQTLSVSETAETVVQLRPSQILSELGIDPPNSLDSEPQQRAEGDTQNKHLGRFLLEDELGCGGMGRIYQARDPELRRTVAIKVLLDPKEVKRATLARFVSEAQITSQLDHPNIIPIHEIGATEDGEVYFVMKKVEGRTLSKILADVRGGDEEWTQYRLLNVFIKICDALAYAHDRGVLHRDLKPDNIMLGRFGEVLVMDWGVARLITDKTEEVEDHGSIEIAIKNKTVDGTSVGTPGYMSPEQAKGQLDRLGPSSDVWSLGAILYEMLALRQAYEADDSFSLMMKALKPPVPPSTRSPEMKTHPEIEAVCLKALQPEPSQRYPSAVELGRAVEDYLEGSKRREKQAQKARLRRRITVAGLSILALVALSMVLLWRRADVAREQAVDLRAEAELSESETRQALVDARLSQLISNARHRELTGQQVEALALFRAATQLEDGDISHLAAEIERLIAAGGVSLVLSGAPEDYLRDVRCSSDGTFFVAATWHWAVVWDTATGEQLLSLQGHTDIVRSVAVANDLVLATGSDDGTAMLWDLRDGSSLAVLAHHTAPITEVLFDSTGEHLLSGSEDGTIGVWRTADGTLLGSLTGHEGPINDIHLSVNGDQLASGSSDGTVRLWDVGARRLLATLTSGDAPVSVIAWSSAGRLASGDRDGRVRVWVVDDIQIEFTQLASHTGEVSRLTFSNDGSLLASGGEDGVVNVFQANSGQLLYQTTAHESGITDLMFLRDDSWLVTAGAEGVARIWSADGGVLLRQLVGHEDSIDTIDVGPNGDWLATGSSDTTVRLWALRDGPLFAMLSAHNDRVENVWFTPTGSLLAGVSIDGEIVLWDGDTYELLNRYQTHQESTMVISRLRLPKAHFRPPRQSQRAVQSS